MDISIDSASLLGGIEELRLLGQQANESANYAAQTTLNGSYSGVSGLDQLGGGHGGVINGGTGSAISVLKSYAEQVNWLDEALAASYQALTGQNAFVARGMDIADEGGSVGEDAVTFPTRPAPRFENFSFTPPLVTPAASIDQLSAEFSMTKIQESVAAAATWKKLSAEATAISQGLHSIAGELGSSNQGEVVEAAVEKISEVARAGETFSQNAATMGTSVEQLAAIKSQGAVKVNLTKAALAAIVEPAERIAAEQAFLQSFPASFSPFVATGVPPIRNLMVMDASGDGGSNIALGMSEIDGDGEKHDAAGMRAPGASQGLLHAAGHAMGAGNFGTASRGIDAVAGVDGSQLLQANQVATVAASTTSGTSALSGPGSLGSGIGTSGGTSGGLAAGSPGFGGPVPASLPGGLAARSAVSGPSRGFSTDPAALANMAGMGTARNGSGSVLGTGAGMPAVGRASGSAGLGAAGSSGTSAGTAGSGVRAATPAVGSGIAPATTASGTNAVRPSNGQSSGRSMMPMMGAPMTGGAGGGSKTPRIKAVTSAVEQDDNTAALLGDRGSVVPGVIGAWARG
ncbi:hypothetical protein [Corynebacterium alimapuense]|uniref:PPE family domain-containing protein n=1 Tax=Corynebacterium alimapuense TaxID=1576874 RepID=A0A3M8KAW3_9CORY|nr:hypothetical protein [Corynebacterium alimapuense]RNE49598.1 hypothetical protein C5L39_04450 [Corynebacterium alimapuense]